jgi:Rad3-related DNA helicase
MSFFLADDIQLNLMRHVYSALEAREIAIVESPTGKAGEETLSDDEY